MRGVTTNVANYNALVATGANPNYDESYFIAAFQPLLVSAGFPGNFIVEQGRSGAQLISGGGTCVGSQEVVNHLMTSTAVGGVIAGSGERLDGRYLVMS